MRVAFTGTHIHDPRQRPDHRRQRLRARSGTVPRSACRAASRPRTRSATGHDIIRYLAPHARQASTWAPATTRTSAPSARTRSVRTASCVQPADVISGTGNDLVTYRSAQRAVPRVARRPAQRRRPQQGEHPARRRAHRGLEGNDTLIGSNDPNKVEQFTGLERQRHHEGSRRDRRLQRGPRPERRRHDRRPGRHRPASTTRSGRPPSRSTWRACQRNSGAPGEGDFIDPNTNNAIGGLAGRHADRRLGRERVQRRRRQRHAASATAVPTT